MRRLLTPGDVRRLLAEHGVAPRKAAGQHFVVDPNTVRKVARDAGVGPSTLVCEVGPGLGSLTLALRERQAPVVALEIDAGLVRALSEVLGGDPGVYVVHGDALRTDWQTLLVQARDRLGVAPATPAAMVANLPYATATPIVFAALASGSFAELFVMVQREVGRRWAARVGDPLYGAVSVKLAAWAQVKVESAVARTAFWPVPNVDSVTVRLQPRAWTGPVAREEVAGLVDAGFAQRRKRLRNALARGQPGWSPQVVEAALAGASLDPGARAEELALPDWVALAARLRGLAD